MPNPGPDCHLVRTSILSLPSYDSLGVFHNKLRTSYPFLQVRFHWAIASGIVATIPSCSSQIPQIHSRQATLHAAFIGWFSFNERFLRSIPPCRFFPAPYSVIKRRAQKRVSTEKGSVPACHCGRPLTLTSSIHPKLGVRSKHKRLHRCALMRIFRLSLKVRCID